MNLKKNEQQYSASTKQGLGIRMNALNFSKGVERVFSEKISPEESRARQIFELNNFSKNMFGICSL